MCTKPRTNFNENDSFIDFEFSDKYKNGSMDYYNIFECFFTKCIEFQKLDWLKWHGSLAL